MTPDPTKVLLTWYGITDYRASLGFERDGDGPVLGALKAEPYALVLVLGYLNKGKPVDPTCDIAGECARREASATPASQRAFVDETANTAPAHRHFVSWLKSHLADANIQTRVEFHPVPLADLNDTDGIYKSATAALDCIANLPGDFDVSLFLSPGTPVMAFTWALAALRFPRLNRRLISSSRPPRPPETIRLPEEWKGWTATTTTFSEPFQTEYDVVFHLFGDQKMPTYWGIRHLRGKRHVFVTSPQYDPKVFRHFLGKAQSDVLHVSPFDPNDVERRIRQFSERLPNNAKLAFNLTGGTKLMYAGTLSACRQLGGVPFYFNIENHSIVCLDEFESRPMINLDTITPFIKLNGLDLQVTNEGRFGDIRDGADPERWKLTKLLWLCRSNVAPHYKELVKFQPKQWNGRSAVRFTPFVYPEKGKGGFLSAQLTGKGAASVRLNGQSFSFAKFETLASYLTGGWFEEYVYANLMSLQEKGLIHDLRINFEVSFLNDNRDSGCSFKGRRGPSLDPYQEMDLVFTDGSRLYIVECKAGNVTLDHVSKLQTITRNFGGVGGRGVLACCFPPRAAQRKRLSEARECRCVFGEKIADQIEAIIRDDRRKYLSVQAVSTQQSN